MSRYDEEEIKNTLNSYQNEENEKINRVNYLIKQLDCNYLEKTLLSKIMFSIDKNRKEAENQKNLHLERTKSYHKNTIRRNIMFVEEARRYYLNKLCSINLSEKR